jgi:hypothetical protein
VVSPLDRDAWIASGSFSGFVGNYQRHDFSKGKSAALDAWGSEVERIVRESRRAHNRYEQWG